MGLWHIYVRGLTFKGTEQRLLTPHRNLRDARCEKGRLSTERVGGLGERRKLRGWAAYRQRAALRVQPSYQ